MLLPRFQSDQSAGTFDVEELRDLVFRGIPETDTSPRITPNSSSKTSTDTASDLLRPRAWRVLLGVVKGDPRAWPNQLRCHREDYQKWKRDLVGGTSCQRGNGATRTEAEHHGDIFLMKEIEKVSFAVVPFRLSIGWNEPICRAVSFPGRVSNAQRAAIIL